MESARTMPAPPAPPTDHDRGICPFVTSAWARLLQVAPTLLASVEADLKAAALPPAQWYGALSALERAPMSELAPGDLESQLLLTQCTTSRLIDRLVAEGLATRQVHPADKRRQIIRLSKPGKQLIDRMWPVYAEAIERHIGRKLDGDDAKALNRILEKLA